MATDSVQPDARAQLVRPDVRGAPDGSPSGAPRSTSSLTGCRWSPTTHPVCVAVLTSFGVGTVSSAVGLVVAGVAVLRRGVWSGWRRVVPLVLGVWMVAMMPLQFTAALPIAVVLSALAVMALGLAMVREGLEREPAR